MTLRSMPLRSMTLRSMTLRQPFRWGALILAPILALAGCGDGGSRTLTALPGDLQRFAATPKPVGVARSNLDIADDFLDLVFRLEGGETVPALLKYDGPIRVALRSPGLATYKPEIDALLGRLRKEAGIDIRQVPSNAPAEILVHAVSRQNIQRAVPGAACFIEPGVTTWQEFRNPLLANRRVGWNKQTRLGQTSIFIPADSTPQDTRDCLHEEIAQALGPVNDLFRIPDTVFNDDNFHSVLTPFDMVILRALYAPELKPGMTRGEVSTRLVSILNRTNPRGRGQPRRARAPETRAWKAAITRALGRNVNRAQRRSAAERALSLAGAMRPQDHRLGFALLTLGRIEARDNPARARDLLTAAFRQFRTQFGTNDIHTARAALHLGLLSLEQGAFEIAAELATGHLSAARSAENAVVLSGLYAVAAEAFKEMGRPAEARDAQLEFLKWARYAFGDRDGNIAKARAQVASFNSKS